MTTVLPEGWHMVTFVPRLCYVEGCWAYFTTRPLDEQWGDDWDDAPYEHNAGEPYGPCWHNEPKRRGKELCRCASCLQDWNEDGTPTYAIVKVAFECPLVPPLDDGNGFSVKEINAGAVAWLRSRDMSPPIVIQAGATLDEFCEKVRASGGTVYLPKWLGEAAA